MNWTSRSGGHEVSPGPGANAIIYAGFKPAAHCRPSGRRNHERWQSSEQSGRRHAAGRRASFRRRSKNQSNDHKKLEQLCINTIRTLAMDAVQKANSGHPGTPMALAPLAFVLWDRYLKFNPRNPNWAGRDRFILSNGHASMLLYAMLHLTGFDLALDEMKQFRQWGSRTPGHPEYGRRPRSRDHDRPAGTGSVELGRLRHGTTLVDGEVQERRAIRSTIACTCSAVMAT